MFNLTTLLPVKASSVVSGPTSGFLEFGGGRQTKSGEPITPSRALTLSAYFACIRVISEDVAKLPLEVYRHTNPGKECLPDSDLAKLLSIPNPEMTGYTFRETLTQWAAGWGNGYAEIVRDRLGKPIALWPIHPSRVRLIRRDGRLVYQVGADVALDAVKQQRLTVEFRTDEIFHIRGMGTGILGYSIAQYGAESIGLGLAAEAFGATFFGQGATSSGILTHPGALTDTAKVNLRESWQKTYGGSKNGNKVAIIEEGMKYEPISIPPEQAQFLETRQFQVEEICRWARVAPHKIQQLLHATFSNIEHQGREHVTDTLLPWMIRWTTEIKRQLITDPSMFVAHDANILMMGDTNARSNFYRTMVNIGVYSPDEVREMEDENPIGGASAQHFMQMNMSTLDRIADGTSVAAPTKPFADTVETAPRVPTEPDDTDAQEQRAQFAAHVESLRPAFVAEADRVLRKEAIAAQRAAAKPGADKWAAEFFQEQAGYITAALSPLAMSLSGIASNVLGVALVSIDVQSFADDYCATARAQFTKASTLPDTHTPAVLAESVIGLVLVAYPESRHVVA